MWITFPIKTVNFRKKLAKNQKKHEKFIAFPPVYLNFDTVSGRRKEALAGSARPNFDVHLAKTFRTIPLISGSRAVAVDSLVGVATLKMNADIRT
jgi:hypothetical protein